MELEKNKNLPKNWNHNVKNPLVFPHPYKVERGE